MSDVDVPAIREALAKGAGGPWRIVRPGVVDGPNHYVTFDMEAKTAELIVLLRNNTEALLDIAEHVGTLDRLTGMIAAQRDRAVDALAQQKTALDRAQAASEGVDMLIAQAERRGAVKALQRVGLRGNPIYELVDQFLRDRATAIENGAEL